MATFIEVLPALQNNQRVRRRKWDAATQMHICENGALVQQAAGAPYAYSLDGYEITATDWEVVSSTSIHHQMQAHVAV
jgi:hypothetical protein